MTEKPYQKYTKYYDTKARGGLVNYSKSQKFNIIKTFIPKTGKILDIGSGSGHWLHTFALNGYEVYGVDLAPNCIDLSKQHGYKAYLVDITKEIPFEESSFDIILVNHFIDEFTTMPIPFGSKMPKWLIIFLCNQLLKRGYDVGVWEITTVARKV